MKHNDFSNCGEAAIPHLTHSFFLKNKEQPFPGAVFPQIISFAFNLNISIKKQFQHESRKRTY
jgi:hypothetical protein